MASGTFTGTTNNEYITPRISWSSTPNNDTNKSSLTVRFQLKKSSASTAATYGTGSWTMTIGGSSYSFSDVITIKTNNTYITVYSKTVPISHDDDGGKSVAIKVTGGIPGTTYTSTSLSKTIELDTIPRSSAFSVPSSVNTGSALNITITPSSNTFRHRFRFEIDGVAKYTSGYIAAGTKSYSYTIPHTWLPSSTSKTMKVYCYTYPASGDSYIARITKNVTANVPSTIKPTISSLTSAIVSGLDGKYVASKSKIKLTVSATAGSGSSINSYIYKGTNINGNSTSYTGTSNSRTSSIIQSSGTKTYTVTVKDARGRVSDPKTVSVTVYAYSKPQITSISAQRCLSNGTLSDEGTCAKVTVKTTHANIDGANTGNVVLTNNKDETSKQVISSTKASNTYSGVYGSGFDINSSYTITATITDEYGASHTLSTTLKAVQRTLNIAKYGNGLAVGKLSMVESKSDTPRFECNWDTTFYDDVRIKHTSSRCFEFIRTGISDDIDNDGTNETADIQGQLYIADNGSVTCRRRYSTDNSETYTAQGYWQLRNEDMYVNDDLTVNGQITTNDNFGFNGSYSDHNFNIYGQWADGSNHDMLVRNTDGLSMGLGWTGGDSYETSLDIRPKTVNIRGKTTVQGFRVPEIQKGSLSIVPSATNTPTAKIVTFDKKFSGTPVVMVNPLTGAPGTIVLGVAAADPNESQVTIYLTRTNTTSTGVQWLAIY